jgi:cytochrome bd-type quinol oxidase subunit 1
MLAEIIAIAVWAVLAYSDYKYLSISNRVYAAAIVILASIFALNFVLSFKLAFVSLIVGIAIYIALHWYLKEFMASADKTLLLLSLLAFPLPAIAGLALVALRGAWKGKSKYYPALTYFAIGFIILGIIYLWI